MSITVSQREELLSFNDGNPLIVTPHESSDCIESFNILAFVRTISSPAPKYISSVSLLLLVPATFPAETPAVQLSQCRTFHPNFTDDGRWLGSELENNESLSAYLMRLIRVLQYKEIDTENIANRNAMAWYNAHRGLGTFPTDPINYLLKPRIAIHRISEGSQPARIQPIQIGAIHYE
jgi:ubiquitin-protein ligase